MITRISPSIPHGNIKAIASKSIAHRLLICAAFSDKKTVIRCEETNKDIEATANCLRALGVKIERASLCYEVTPIAPAEILKKATLPCGESGSTLRFLLPVVAALGVNADFIMEGRLPERPLAPLDSELEANGVILSREKNILHVSGKLCGEKFKIAGNVSSQFISGMLLALSLLKNSSTLTIEGKIESSPYIELTTDALRLFRAEPKKSNSAYIIDENTAFISPERIEVEGDWSNAAFPLCLGVMGKGKISVSGLSPTSSQGDMAIVEIIKKFGGKIKFDDGRYVAESSKLHAADIDASQIPDLVPVLATLASVAEGQTRIYGAARLRLKESDRLTSTCEFLSALGADISATDDGLVINGRPSLKGGSVSSYNDHRIAMSAAVAAAVCSDDVTVDGSEATDKSYPAFWNDMRSLNIHITDINREC